MPPQLTQHTKNAIRRFASYGVLFFCFSDILGHATRRDLPIPYVLTILQAKDPNPLIFQSQVPYHGKIYTLALFLPGQNSLSERRLQICRDLRDKLATHSHRVLFKQVGQYRLVVTRSEPGVWIDQVRYLLRTCYA